MSGTIAQKVDTQARVIRSLNLIHCADTQHIVGAVELERLLNLEVENLKLKQRIKRLEEALEECDWAFTKFCPEHESRYGDAWEKVRDALNRPNPFKPYWQEAKP